MTPDFSLSGGVALVTGAGSGIGRAIALGLAGAGAHVGCVDRVPRHVEATAAEILAAGSRAVPVAADVTDPAAMSAAVAQIESALGPLTPGAECHPDEHRNLDSTRSENLHAGRCMASDHATYSHALTTMESSGRRS